ncbi:hypothetical protein [Cohnella yongneupensis]|uniref:Uncharacterized protein n=1 Tax=Cohnella yongneupensis TaxID=425006 RepID=A0ABW0R3B2_9BACL
MENDRFEVQVRPELAPPQASAQQVMTRVVIAAIAAALIGAVAWGYISYESNKELGLLAWAIGALVGYAVAFMAKSSLRQNHLVISVICALGGVIGGKYLDYYLIVRDIEKEFGISLDGELSFTDMFGGYDILWIAFAVVTAWTLPSRMLGRFQSQNVF